MSKRIQLTFCVVTLCALSAVLIVGALAHQSDQEAVGQEQFIGSRQPPNAPAPDFALQDQDGKLVRMRDYHGQILVLTFLYSTCTDTCPLLADQIRGALDNLQQPIPALAITVDPAHDTPRQMRRFLVAHRLRGRMRFLSGSPKQLAPVWKAYGIQAQTSAFDHSSYVLLIDRTGLRRISFPLDQLTPPSLEHDLRALLAEPTD